MLDETLTWWRLGILEHLHRIKELAELRWKEIPIVTCPTIEGTYLMFSKFDCEITSLELKDYLLKEAKIAFSEGSIFGIQGESHLRMTIATSLAILNEVFDRVESVLKNL
jgi:cystathionine beta-lyase